MLNNIIWKTLWDQRRSLSWWSIGFAGLIISIMLFYPFFIENIDSYAGLLQDASDDPLMRIFAGGDLLDMASPAGFINVELMAFMVPLLYVAFAITTGSAAIAGEESRGTLDFLLSNPVTRRQIILQKYGAMVGGVVILTLINVASFGVGVVIVNMEINFWRIVEATISTGLLGLVFGAMAFSLGATFGKRGGSVGITSGVAVGSYLLHALGPLVEWLKPFTKISPFYYQDQVDMTKAGLDPLHTAFFVFAGILFLSISVVFFERRDIGLG